MSSSNDMDIDDDLDYHRLSFGTQIANSLNGNDTQSTRTSAGRWLLQDLEEIKSKDKKENNIIDLGKWNKLFNYNSIDKRQVDELVLNYLVVEGHKDLAETFIKDSGLEYPKDLHEVGKRFEIRQHLLRGEVEQAINKVNTLYPNMLKDDDELRFCLYKQGLIELIAQRKFLEATEYASCHLIKLCEQKRKFLPELEQVMCLLAFEDPRKGVDKQLLSMNQRELTAELLNTALLEVIGCPSKAILKSLNELLMSYCDQP